LHRYRSLAALLRFDVLTIPAKPRFMMTPYLSRRVPRRPLPQGKRLQSTGEGAAAQSFAKLPKFAAKSFGEAFGRPDFSLASIRQRAAA